MNQVLQEGRVSEDLLPYSHVSLQTIITPLLMEQMYKCNETYFLFSATVSKE